MDCSFILKLIRVSNEFLVVSVREKGDKKAKRAKKATKLVNGIVGDYSSYCEVKFFSSVRDVHRFNEELY